MFSLVTIIFEPFGALVQCKLNFKNFYNDLSSGQGEVKQGEFYEPMYSSLLFEDFTALRLATRRLGLQVLYSFLRPTRKKLARPFIHKQTNEIFFPSLLPESLKDFM